MLHCYFHVESKNHKVANNIKISGLCKCPLKKSQCRSLWLKLLYHVL